VAEDSIGLEFTKEEHGEVEKTSCWNWVAAIGWIWRDYSSRVYTRFH
jgi:hypothetical protein